jgi:Fe-S cluster assembly protein SufD
MKEIIEKRKKESYQIFKELPMPSSKLESWKYTFVKELDISNFKPISQIIEFPQLSDEVKKKGVIFVKLSDAIENNFEILSEHLPMGLVKNDEDKFTAMHASFFNDGIFVHVPKNTKLDLPLRNIFRTTGQGGVFSHSIIILEEGAEITYVEEHYSEKYIGDTLRNDVVEIYAKKNSKINFINFQNWNDNVINITNWKGKIDQDAQINFYSGQFGGKLSRIKTDVMMNGLNSSSKNKSVFFANNNQHFDITTNIDHNVKHTTGDTLVKGVLDDSATSVFRGMIKIIDDAQHTDSYLSNHSLILSNNAVSNSIPSLQIDADEVRASHGATIGKPDEEEIFYLMARGLSRKEAERLIILGYFSPIIDEIQIDDIKKKFDDALKNKVR